MWIVQLGGCLGSQIFPGIGYCNGPLMSVRLKLHSTTGFNISLVGVVGVSVTEVEGLKVEVSVLGKVVPVMVVVVGAAEIVELIIR